MRIIAAFLAAAIACAPVAYPAQASEEVEQQGKLYVTSWFGGVISVVDVASGELTNSIPVGVQDHNVVLNPDQTQAWVTNNNDGTVSAFDQAPALHCQCP